jgi:hypothetical protein
MQSKILVFLEVALSDVPFRKIKYLGTVISIMTVFFSHAMKPEKKQKKQNKSAFCINL